MTVPSRVTAGYEPSQFGPPDQHRTEALTLGVLPLIVTDRSRSIHCLADNGVATGVLHSLLYAVVEGDTVNSEPRRPQATQLVVGRLSLNGVEWDKGRLAGTLHSHVFYTVDSRFLGIDNNRINVSTENCRDSEFVFLLSRPAQVDDATANALIESRD